MTTCTICEGDFDLELEGGDVGCIGILPVAFCPTCKAGIMDYADQFRYLELDDEEPDEMCRSDHCEFDK